MKGTTHLAFGLSTSLVTTEILSNLFTTDQQIIFITTSVLGSVILDIDNENSIIGKSFKPFSTIIQNVFGHRTLFHNPFFVLVMFLIFKFLINITVPYEHNRFIVLSVIMFLLISLSFISNLKEYRLFKSFFLFFIAPIFLWLVCSNDLYYSLYGITFGAIGHLLLDIPTIQGISWFRIFKNKNKEKEISKYKKLFKIKSGSWCETILAFFIFILFFTSLTKYNELTNDYSSYNPIEITKEIILDKK